MQLKARTPEKKVIEKFQLIVNSRAGNWSNDGLINPSRIRRRGMWPGLIANFHTLKASESDVLTYCFATVHKFFTHVWTRD